MGIRLFLPLRRTQQLSLPPFPEGLPQGPLSLRLLLFESPQRLRNVPPSRSFVGYRLKKATPRHIRPPPPRSFPLRFSRGRSLHSYPGRPGSAAVSFSHRARNVRQGLGGRIIRGGGRRASIQRILNIFGLFSLYNDSRVPGFIVKSFLSRIVQ